MRILRNPDACALTGDKRATFYLKVKDKLLPRPIPLGGRSVGWPEPELIAVNRARVAGKTDDEIRALVQVLEADRTKAAAA